MIFHRETGQLLGTHCIGSGATELVHVGQAVQGLGGGLDYFLDTVFNFPTLAECYKVAAFNAANKINFARRVRALQAKQKSNSNGSAPTLMATAEETKEEVEEKLSEAEDTLEKKDG